MAHSKHSQIEYITSALIVHYRYAAQTNDRGTKKKTAEAIRTLYKHKKYYYTLEKYYADTDYSESNSSTS